MKKSAASGQAHHISQNAAFRDVIDPGEGLSIKLKGNILTEPNSPHYKAHKTLESFWNDYRKGGKYYGSKPTVQQYNKSAYRSLINANISKKDADTMV